MSNLKKILMVDDDADLREALADQLVITEEFDVFEAGTGADGLAKASEQHYDLVILDVGLPDMDGRELCRLMRKQGIKCPILMLTGHTTDSDTILGLDAGANHHQVRSQRVAAIRQDGAHLPLLEGRGLPHGTEPHLTAEHLCYLGLVYTFNGRGQRIVRPGAFGAVIFAKPQHNALFIRIDYVDAREQPKNHHSKPNKQKTFTIGEP